MLTAEQLERRKAILGSSDCQCLARQILALVQAGHFGRVDLGHMNRPAFDRLVAMVQGSPEITYGANGVRRYVTLWAECDGLRIYAQADAEVRDADK